MQKSAPSFGRISAMVVFALSCFGLLLFLWLAFGGPIPLKPEGYRFQTSFTEATQLAKEADVRISGVPVGKVKDIVPDKRTGRSTVTIELESRYAPVPADARAILRQKTLLGETYVELTPGTRSGPKVADGGMLAQGQISPTVELDEIFRSFDQRTRTAFQTWMREQAIAIEDRGRDLNDALGNLGPLAEDAAQLVDVLNRQEGAVQRLVSDTGTVFEALTERDGQLRQLIENSNTVFAATASRDRELQEAFIALPTFERESRATVQRLEQFAEDTDPLVTQLRPAARELSPTLEALRDVAPDLNAIFSELGTLITVARKGFPAAEKVLDDVRPLLDQLDPALRQVIPVLLGLQPYKSELTAFFANSVGATQAFDVPPGSTDRLRYLRTTNPLNPENLAVYPRRIGSNRTNPYVFPGKFSELQETAGLDSFETRHCNAGTPSLLQDLTGITSDTVGILADPEFLAKVQQFGFQTEPGGTVPRPPCREQQPYPFGGEVTKYPHVNEEQP